MFSLIRKHKALTSVVLICILILVLRFEILSAIGSFLVLNEPLSFSEVIHALGGGSERIDYSTKLYKADYGNRLFFSGSESVIPPTQSPYSKLIHRYVGEKEVPDNAIFVRPASSTYEDATALRTFLLQKDLKSVIVVSSPYHMRRVRMVFNKVIPKSVRLTYNHVPWQMSNMKKKWWTDEHSIDFVISEYIKLGYYFFRYIL